MNATYRSLLLFSVVDVRIGGWMMEGSSCLSCRWDRKELFPSSGGVIRIDSFDDEKRVDKEDRPNKEVA